MPVSTINTILNYAGTCPLQVESLTVAVTTVTTGNISVTVKSRDIAGSAVTGDTATFTVAVTAGWTATQVADAIKTKLNDLTLSNLSSVYTVGGTSPTITLTRKVASSDDSQLLVTVIAGQGVNGATSTNTTAGGTFTKLCDIVSYPDMGTTPSKLDSTTLSETSFKTQIFGLQELPDLTFDCNYDDTVLNTINGLTGVKFLQLDFGSTDGRFNWTGEIKAYANGGGVDEVRKMTVVCSAVTPITFNVTNY